MESQLTAAPAGLLAIIKQRRSVFPPAYSQRPIEREVILQILESARWAPNHHHTEPWRFRVLRGSALITLGNFLASHYKDSTPEEKFSEIKFKKKRKNPTLSSAVIAICMKRDERKRVPEWEELAAVSCAVQNMWLMCTTHGIGAYWGSPPAIKQAGELLQLENGEQCLGFLFMGYTDEPWPDGQRESLDDKVVWMDT